MVLIFRKSRVGRLSIEKVFKPLEKIVEKAELPCELNSFYNGILILKFLLKIKSKKIHITGDVHYVSFLLFWKKSILTIHDLNNYEAKRGIGKYLYGFIWFWLPLRAANIITVISPYTKQQLEKYFKIDEKKIKIINNSFIPIHNISTVNQREKWNILVIGTKKNKNISNLISAVRGMRDVRLSIVGQLDEETRNILKANDITYHIYFNLTETELAIVYNNADILFFASTKEGFGLPILEAQSIGLPVITSDTTAMPYVAGKGALIVDPYSVREIKTAILKIKTNKNIKNEIIREGYENVRRFDTKNFVESYLKLYDTI